MNNRHKGTLDFIKIVAITLIVFLHWQQFMDVKYSSGINFIGGKFDFGYIVELFFVISGFNMYKYIKQIQEGMTFEKFYSKRALRLLPLTAFAAFIYYILEKYVDFSHFLIEYVDTGNNWPEPSLYGVVLESLGIQSGWASQDPRINAQTWYVSVLLLCYILFYFVVQLAHKKKWNYKILILCIVLLGILGKHFSISLPFLNWRSVRGYYSFFIGVLLSEYYENMILTKKKTALLLLVCLLSLTLIYLEILRPQYVVYVLVMAFYPSIILLLKNFEGTKVFNNCVMNLWGGYVFDAFIWHLCVLIPFRIVVHNTGYDISSPKFMLLFMGIVWAVAAISHSCISRPLNALAEKIYKWLTS